MDQTLFERASRLKLRFSYKGLCAVEDLWDLTLEDLNELYKESKKKVDAASTDSLLKPTQVDEESKLRVDIVTHVFQVKQQEQIIRQKSKDQAAQKQKLLAILADKEYETLRGKSPDELRQMIEDL